MIDIDAEKLMSMKQAAQLIPGNCDGGGISPPTMHRWITLGYRAPGNRRVRLESIRIGGRVFTSREAIQRFLQAQNEPQEPSQRAKPSRSHEIAMAQLKLAGYC